MTTVIPRLRRAGVIGLVLAALPLVVAGHEARDVGNGKYAVEVGFVTEPAYLAQPNGLFLKVVRHDAGAMPVAGLADELRVEVSKDGVTMPLSLVPQPEAGVYHAPFLPTALGDYTFRLVGQIGGEAVDESFTSSPEGFGGVKPLDAVQFPVDAPAGEALVRRLEEAEDEAAGARILAITGVGAGAVGLLVTLLTFWQVRGGTRRRTATP